MANTLLTIGMITREALRLFKNTNSFINHIDTQYDDRFAKVGAKIGTSLQIRLPNDYTIRKGAALQAQDTAERSTTLTVATQVGVDVSFSSLDRTMSLDDFGIRVLAPMMNRLVGEVAAEVMTGADGGSARFVANLDGGGNVLKPTLDTWLSAGALLDINSAPQDPRRLVCDPFSMARAVSSMAGQFNPNRKISDQFDSGEVTDALGFAWFKDQTVLKHKTAAYTGANNVATTTSTAGYTGLALPVAAVGGGLAIGDIITIDGVNMVNRVNRLSTGQLQQFVVTAPVANNGVVINLYPAIVPPVGGNEVQYQTVDAAPANGANVNVVTLASATFRKNLAFMPEAVTMATADLVMPTKGVEESAREVMDGVSMRMISAYNIGTDQFATRLDVLFGFAWLRPEWVVTVGDVI